MSMKLVPSGGTRAGIDIAVDSPEFVIGGDPSCQLQIEHVCVSRRHCRIASDGGRFLVEDLGSAFGTEVNGRKIRTVEVRDGDRLRVGFEEFVLAIEANGAPSLPPAADLPVVVEPSPGDVPAPAVLDEAAPIEPGQDLPADAPVVPRDRVEPSAGSVGPAFEVHDGAEPGPNGAGGVSVVKVLDPGLMTDEGLDEFADELGGLIKAGHHRIVLDLAVVEEVAPAVLGALTFAHRQCREAGGALKLCAIRPEVAAGPAGERLRRFLRIYADEAEAIASDWSGLTVSRPRLGVAPGLPPAAPPERPDFQPDPVPGDADDPPTQDEIPVASLMSTLEKSASTSFESRADLARPEVPASSTAPTATGTPCVRLIAEGGKAKGQAVEVRGVRFLIGRDEGCHIRARSDLVSRVHAAIDQVDGKVFARDLGSTNGTIVNDRELRDEEVQLADGDRLQIGPLRFTVAIPPGLVMPVPARPSTRLSPPADRAQSVDDPSHTSFPDFDEELEATDDPVTMDEIPVATLMESLRRSATTSFESRTDLRPPTPADPGPTPNSTPSPAADWERACLVALDERNRGQIIELDQPRFLIGRDEVCNIRARSDLISRVHAILELHDGKLFLRDMASTNGSMVNDRELRNAEVELADNDQIRLGPLHFAVAIPPGLVTPPPVPPEAEQRIEWDHEPESAPEAPAPVAPPPSDGPSPPRATTRPSPSPITTPAAAPPWQGAPAAPGPYPPPTASPQWSGAPATSDTYPAAPPWPANPPPWSGAPAAGSPAAPEAQDAKARQETLRRADPDLAPVVDELTQGYLQDALARVAEGPEALPIVPGDLEPKKAVLLRKSSGFKKPTVIFAVRFFEFWHKVPTKNKIALFLILLSAPIFAWRWRDVIRSFAAESVASRSQRAVDAAIADKEALLKPIADPNSLTEAYQWLHLVGPLLKKQAAGGKGPEIRVPLQDQRSGLATIQLGPGIAPPTMEPTLMLFWTRDKKGEWVLDGHSSYLSATRPPDSGGE